MKASEFVMQKGTSFEELAEILQYYRIKPTFVENFGKIHKVYAKDGTFAVKVIDPHNGTDFLKHVQFLYQKGYNRIVPIYPTHDGRYAVLHKNQLYYLMPWLTNEEREDHTERTPMLFRELARLHTLSSKETTISSEERTEHYETTIAQLEKDREFLTGFIEECEQKWYMSPFELLFCMYYQDISQALTYSQKRLEEWYEGTKEKEKVRMVITHGKISSEHFLYDERGYGYFINFEKSRPGSPIHDLLPFLSRSLKTYPKRADDAVEWLTKYFKYFPFKEDENHLFMSYLAHPGQILRVAEKYHKRTTKKDELKLVQQLQKRYWHLKNIEYVVMKLTEIEEQKKAQAQAQAQAAQQEAQS